MEVYDMRCPELFREDFNKGEFFHSGIFVAKYAIHPYAFLRMSLSPS